MKNIYYGVCFYYDRMRLMNVWRHIGVLRTLRTTFPGYTFTCVVNCMMDEADPTVRAGLMNEFHRRILGETAENALITHNYNYGGTIAGLQDLYTCVTSIDISDAYVMYFEEDFYAKNMQFLVASLDTLTPDMTYVGEITSTTACVKSTSVRPNAVKKASRLFGSEEEVWTDGGYYFTSVSRLQAIEKKIPAFHFGDKTTKYNHAIDGIDYGEVGFPTSLYHNGFRFIGLPRYLFFIHD